MSQLIPYQASAASRVGRSLARLSDQTTLALATTHMKAELEAAKVHGVATVTATALQEVALISQMEQSLAQAVPHASGRLATVADLSALAMAEVVANAARAVSR